MSGSMPRCVSAWRQLAESLGGLFRHLLDGLGGSQTIRVRPRAPASIAKFSGSIERLQVELRRRVLAVLVKLV